MDLHRATKRRSLNRTTSKAAGQQFEMLEEEFLSHDMIMEILLRLPVISLLQFKCVCKSWKTLISDPQFAKDHLRYSMADTGTKYLRLAFTDVLQIVSWPVKPFFDNNNKTSTPLPPLPLTPPKPIRVKMTGAGKLILGSCNGLLCLYDIYDGFVVFWNPSTRLMSKSSLHIFESRRKFMTNAGFGYDQVNDKYKLIVMLAFGVPTQEVIKICTFGATNNFSATICNLPPPNTTHFFGKFVSGTLNWIVTGGLECDLSKYKWTIFWFNLEKETCHEMLLPKQHTSKTPVLGVLNNCLCVSFFDSHQTHWVVWSMKKHGAEDSWTKFITISLLNIYYPGLDLLYISKSGVLLGLCQDLFVYDPVNGRIEYSIKNDELGYAQQIYHESLISPPC